MNTDFRDVMMKRTDEELIQIVTVDRDGYQPLAIEAAEAEIKKRAIDITKIEQVKVDLTTQMEGQKMVDAQKAPLSARLIHFFVDTIVVCFLIGTSLFILGDLMVRFSLSLGEQQLPLLAYAIMAAGFFGYYVFMETQYQKTIGKFMTKTKVVNIDGTKPQVGDIVRRTFCRLIPFDRVSFLFTSDGFHDKLSETTIIKDTY